MAAMSGSWIGTFGNPRIRLPLFTTPVNGGGGRGTAPPSNGPVVSVWIVSAGCLIGGAACICLAGRHLLSRRRKARIAAVLRGTEGQSGEGTIEDEDLKRHLIRSEVASRLRETRGGRNERSFNAVAIVLCREIMTLLPASAESVKLPWISHQWAMVCLPTTQQCVWFCIRYFVPRFVFVRLLAWLNSQFLCNLFWGIVARTGYFDASLSSFLYSFASITIPSDPRDRDDSHCLTPAHKGQVLFLGAGYDDRFLRFSTQRKLKGIAFYEVDLPDVQQDKLRIIASHPQIIPRGALENIWYVTADFTRERELEDRLQEKGFVVGAGMPTWALLEGVSMYLTSEIFWGLLRQLRSLLAPSRGTLSFDYLDSRAILELRGSSLDASNEILDGWTELLPRERSFLDVNDERGTPMLFGLNPFTLCEEMLKRGWEVVENNTSDRLAQRFVAHRGFHATEVSHLFAVATIRPCQVTA